MKTRAIAFFMLATLALSVAIVGGDPKSSALLPAANAASSFQTSSGLIASDPLNKTLSQSQLSASNYWRFGGDAIGRHAPYSFYENSSGLHIGVESPGNGTYAGFLALSPNTNFALAHVELSAPVETIPSGRFESGLYVQTANGNINYVTCTSVTTSSGTLWEIVSALGNTNQATSYDVLWASGPGLPLTEDCTIITNGQNYIKVFLDGVMVFSSVTLSLNIPPPFQAYLEPESSYSGAKLNATFQNYYITSGEKLTVNGLTTNASSVQLINSTGTLLASAPVSCDSAQVEVANFIFPLKAIIQVVDKSGKVIASTQRPVGIYGGDTFTLNSTEYPQYYVTFSSAVVGGGSGYLPPLVSYFSHGSKLSVSNGSAVCADASSEYFYPKVLGGSNHQERWATIESVGTITSSGTITPNYYNQYPITINYSVIDGGSPEGLKLIFTSLGNSFEYTLNQTMIQQINSQGGVFVDAGSFYSIANSLQGSTLQERWYDSSAPSGRVTSTLALTAEFIHQYYLTITTNSSVAGSVSPASGWYDASQSVKLFATPNAGWVFTGWSGTGSGSYSGADNPASTVLNSPISEEALFTLQIANSTSSSTSSSSSSTGLSTSTSGVQNSSTVPKAPPPGNESATTVVGNSAFSLSITEQKLAFVAAAVAVILLVLTGSMLLVRRRKKGTGEGKSDSGICGVWRFRRAWAF